VRREGEGIKLDDEQSGESNRKYPKKEGDLVLREYTLLGEVDKVQIAINKLKEFEPPEGYYLAFSGGKDSVVIYDLAVKAGVKFDAHYNITTVDPPELVRFIKQKYPDVQRDKPKKTMWQLIIENGTPPTRLMRYCCKYLKEQGGEGRVCITGVRWAESAKRKNTRGIAEYASGKSVKDKILFNDNDEMRKMMENCQLKGKFILNPIIDWTDEDVWQYIRQYNIPYCSLYDEGFKRLGCVMCPMAGTNGMLKEAKRWPRIYAQYLRTFEKMLAERRRRGRPTVWQTPEDVMHWWIYSPPKGNPGQRVIFE